MRPYSAAPDGTQKWSALVLYFFLVGRAAKQFPDPGPGPGAFTPALVSVPARTGVYSYTFTRYSCFYFKGFSLLLLGSVNSLILVRTQKT